MDVAKISEYLPDAATCTLCMNIFHDPVTLNCGHNYCHGCLQKHWAGARSGVHCPQCKRKFDSVTLTSNRQLGNMAWLIRKLQENGVLKKPNRGICEAHKQLLVSFCQKEQALLCPECKKSQDHTGHVLVSLEGATQYVKNELRMFIDVLKIQKAHLRDSYSDARMEKENVVKLIDLDSERFCSGYKEVYEMMKAVQQEQMKAAKWIVEEIERELDNLSNNHRKVRAFVKELERKFEEPPYEFLKDIKEVRARCKELLAQPLQEGFPPFKEKMWDFSLRSLFVDNTLKRCKDSLPLESVFERANVTMDRLTAHPHLLLSASKKIVTHDATPNGLLPGRQAFDTTPCILAEKGFVTGRHCWQVEVSSSGRGWAFGVMKDSVCRKGPVAISADEGAWALMPKHLPPAEPKASTCCFRLYLDYEGGSVHFYDVATRQPVALLSYATFLGEKVFPFFKLEEHNSQMRVLP